MSDPQYGEFWWAQPHGGSPEFLTLIIAASAEFPEWSALYWEPNGDVGEQLDIVNHSRAGLVTRSEIPGSLTTELSFEAVVGMLRAHQVRA